MTDLTPSGSSRMLRRIAGVEQHEIKAAITAFVYFFFLMASYFILRPLRDTMGTVYGVAHLQELFTGTFLVELYRRADIRRAGLAHPAGGFPALGLRLYRHHHGGFLFPVSAPCRTTAGSRRLSMSGLSTFNLLTISVFWSLMADIFSSAQAKRLFGFIAAGGTVGTISAPAFVTLFVKAVGTNTLLLISAAGFAHHRAFWCVCWRRKSASWSASDAEAQKTTLDHRLGGNPFDGFMLLFRSRYLLMIALFLLLMTWISTVIYFQLGDLISKEFASRAARTQAYATIDLATNSIAVLIQLFGTGRFIQRFGVTTGLLLNPVIMVVAFLAVAFSPVLLVLGAHPGGAPLFRICHRQAQPRHAVHGGGPAGQIQGQECHRHGGLPLRRSDLVLAERGGAAVWRGRAGGVRHRDFGRVVSDRLSAGQVF